MTAPATPHRVTTERRGHVLLVRMERPAKRNAVDAAMTAALDAALNDLEDDPDLWCGVLSGGPGMFCAGTDLAGGAGEPTPRGGNYGVVRRVRSTPLVAAVEGIAYGGGFEIVLACDVVVAGRSARFALPEVARGLVANCGALFRAPRPLPLTVAKQMLLTGQPIGAQRAFDLGLVSELVDDGAAEDAAVALAEQICANSPVAVRATLRAVDAVAGLPDERGWTATAVAGVAIADSADRAEGIAAFLEKRPPRWTGR
ncbi:enoyl-CoA hydratase-related protein [Pseudonocardia benzenivorans]|uniref:Enoyl-CoA hydratase/isomerase n=2 Tax=Pseudonocardia TaxID=1847 RepID=F4CX19_PSEUX|nr:enoyl-CoA hydratase-related protein [Pseudonocardia dioxanivorans]AEA24650.1 Enoyl-CoA hydratase/isomerase [Pseudonocardia dioxanivorans CB1190]GJF04645.1 enoyl-CoA hydratase [Pseudonocardia sp. D17]